jgi:cobalt-zinc-cadmium efflux system membrane fusion protein
MKKYFILACVLISLNACFRNKVDNNSEENTTEDVEEIVNSNESDSTLDTEGTKQASALSVLKLNGKIVVPPHNKVSISVPLGGYLISTKLLEGMSIKKGEIIAVMEDQKYIQIQQDYLTAKALFGSLEKEYFRQKELNESKATSDKVFENAHAQYLSQKVLIKSLSEQLKLISINPDNLNENTISRKINIYSPIDGFVSDIRMNIGKYVNPTDILFELVNPVDVQLALTVFEKDLGKLSIGQKVIAYSNNIANKKYNGEIILIGKDISSDRTAIVLCRFHSFDKSLIPGMYMNAEVELAHQ